jgi:hypothetical protein
MWFKCAALSGEIDPDSDLANPPASLATLSLGEINTTRAFAGQREGSCDP